MILPTRGLPVGARQLLGEKDPDLATSLLELARIQAARGELEDARSAARFVDPVIVSSARKFAQIPPRPAAGKS